MAIISYAQNFEDVMLWRALESLERGFYIDIGAHSPDEWSVTKLFYEKGWRGVNVEPHPKFLAELKAKRSHDINLGIAISDYAGEAEFHEIEDTGLSTLDDEMARRAVSSGRAERTMKVPVMTLAEMWETHVPKGQQVHFLKIDVEGLEELVIRGADWTRHRPWIVVAEATEPMSQVKNHHAWEPLLCDKGYEFVWFDGLNRFYLAKEHADLAQAFEAPPNVFDDFRRAEEVVWEGRAAARLSQTDRKIADLSAEVARLAGYFEAERTERAALEMHLRETLRPLRKFLERTEWASKPLWMRLLFRNSGKPKKLLRRALFHASGKPRGVFKKWILHPDGRPHSPFLQWMSSPEYQSLRAAVRPPGTAGTSATALSPDASRVARRIAALRSPKDHQSPK